jgi:hypothetical protein
MPKATLDRCWSYAEGPGYAKPYGPGYIDIPQGLYDLLSAKGYLDSPDSSEENLEEKLGHKTAQLLHNAGYSDADSVKGASDEELLEIDGIGPARFRKIREDLT